MAKESQENPCYLYELMIIMKSCFFLLKFGNLNSVQLCLAAKWLPSDYYLILEMPKHSLIRASIPHIEAKN